jgi:hypothetical protein
MLKISIYKGNSNTTRYAELVVQMRPATTLVVSLVVPCGHGLRHYALSQPPLVKRSRRRHIINCRQNGANRRL